MPWIQCRDLLDYDLANVLVVDTETTGLDYDADEILQVSVTDLNGSCLYNRFFDSTLPSWPAAERVNGITPRMVADRPTLAGSGRELEELSAILAKAQVIAGYNLKFDLAFLKRAGAIIPKVPFCDVMRDAMAVNNEWILKRVSLKDMCDRFGCLDRGPLHDSLNDCLATSDVALWIAVEPDDVQERIAAYHKTLKHGKT